MPKPYTFPNLYDERRQVKLSKLNEWGYLRSGEFHSFSYQWYLRGEKVADIWVKVNMREENREYVELDYKADGEPVNYKIRLVWVPSNLGKGKIWYFLCPYEKKRCRILYSADKYFFHKEATSGMYDRQTYSKYGITLDKAFKIIHRRGQILEEIHSKYFTKYYNGQATKRYKKLLLELEQLDQIENEALKYLQIF